MPQAAAAAAAAAASMPATPAAAAATPIMIIPPLIHAVAGSLGGALALLLFYPLERARIEMQKQMSASSSSHHHHPTATTAMITPQHRSTPPTTPPHLLLGGSWALENNNDSPRDNKEHQKDDDDDLILVENALTTHHHQHHHHHHHAHISLSTCIRRLWERHELYRGVSPVVLTLAASNFVFFYVHEVMKRIIIPSTSTSPKPTIQTSSLSSSFWSSYGSLLASCLAGIGNVLLTNPLWVANLRIATGESQFDNLVKEMRYVAQTLGWQHLWSGTGASLLLVSNPVLQFFCYEQLKQWPRRRGVLTTSSSSSLGARTTITTTTTPMHAFVAGALAKAIATILTYPLQLAQTVLRLQQQQDDTTTKTNKNNDPDNNNDDSQDDDVYYHGTWDCLRQLYRDDGPGALFTGMRAKLLQTVLTAAFTFLTYEQIAVALHHALIRASSNRTTTSCHPSPSGVQRQPASRPQPMR